MSEVRWARLLGVAAWPYVRYSLDDTSELLRRRLVNFSARDNLCLAELARHEADLDVPIPGWSVAGRMLLPSFRGLLDRLARLEQDRELTDRILALAQQREQRDGSWPPALSVGEPSGSCPSDAWEYEIAHDGSVSIALDREVQPLATGLNLPTRFRFVPL